jgi:glycosyltransferase involved in cell wall biosynthesis
MSTATKMMFTVFTPTHNRAHTLHRPFESLQAQTFRDFEWLVIDDGSSDHTQELLDEWKKRAGFPIRYIRQDHSGKHVAHNRAVREARGKFFLILDSDDACTPWALERMAFHWNEIPSSERAIYSGVSGLCSDQHGKVIGDPFPPDDPTPHERRCIYRVRGEKWGSEMTEIVRRFPFPEIRGTQFVPEAVAWLAMAKIYKTRCVNEIFRIYYIEDSKTGTTLSKKRSLRDNARGHLHYFIWLLNNDLGYFRHSPLPFLKAASMAPVVGLFANQRLSSTLRSLQSVWAKALVLSALPISLLLYIFDRLYTQFVRGTAA